MKHAGSERLAGLPVERHAAARQEMSAENLGEGESRRPIMAICGVQQVEIFVWIDRTPT